MHTALTSDDSMANNSTVEVAIYELATDANNIAYEAGHDETAVASEALTKFQADVTSLGSACQS